jgi:hypothetical protein
MPPDDAPTYEHTQIGYVVIAAMGVSFFGVVLPVLLYLPGADGADLWWGAVAVGGAGILFHALTIRIDDGTLTWYFGPRFWTNELSIDEIERVEQVRNSPWMGWGIRRLRDGWLYNVSGLDAVEVETNDGTVVRLGTDEPEALRRALERARDSA